MIWVKFSKCIEEITHTHTHYEQAQVDSSFGLTFQLWSQIQIVSRLNSVLVLV